MNNSPEAIAVARKMFEDYQSSNKEKLVMHNASIIQKHYAAKDAETPECFNCPECHCEQFTHKDYLGKGFRLCSQCKQEWWTDINYGKIDLHTKPLKQERDQLKARVAELEKEVKDWVFNANELQKQVNGWEPERRELKSRLQELERKAKALDWAIGHPSDFDRIVDSLNEDGGDKQPEKVISAIESAMSQTK